MATKHFIDKFNDTRAWALRFNGDAGGRVVAKWSKSGVCELRVWANYGTPLYCSGDAHKSGKAGGYGYDKFSAAFQDWLDRNGFKTEKDIHGRGAGAVKEYLESLGYKVQEIL